MLQEPFCQICGNRFENTFHALVECEAAQKNIERLINFAGGFRGIASPDMLSIFQELVKKLSRTESEVMVATC